MYIYVIMLISMTLTSMQGHSGLADETIQRRMISTAVRLFVLFVLFFFYMTLTLKTFIIWIFILINQLVVV